MAPAASGSFGELYSKCVQMVNENKISTKNAFDLHLIEHMDDIVDSFMGGRKRKAAAAAAASSTGGGRSSKSAGGQTSAEAEEEHRFHEASCTIEASARIYACRVDCVHTDTYRVLGGLSSADMDDDDDNQGEKASKRRRIVGVNTLERNEANIIQQSIEADEQSDPTFRRMAAAFDAGGAKGLLLSHLPIAEDLSLVFNGDVPLTRAAQSAQPMFEHTHEVPADKLGLGDASAACAKFAAAKLCPAQLDAFRRQLFGEVDGGVSLPAQLEALLGPQGQASLPPAGAAGQAPAAVGQAPALQPIMDGEALAPPDFDAAPELELDAAPFAPPELPMGPGAAPEVPLPLADAPQTFGKVNPKEESSAAFDEMFTKFCKGGGQHDFASFDDAWLKGREGKEEPQPEALADAEGGALVVVPEEGQGGVERKPSRRPLLDLAGLDRPIKSIETEPAQKHQISERAAHWQLHKDVPPYMIDRITMPSWQSWSKHDFACLGMRPHLMLKLKRKTESEGEGDRFSDLYSSVLVENPDAYPWLSGSRASAGSRARGDAADDDARGPRDADFADDGADEGFTEHGLPAHLNVDLQDLFVRPDETVIPGVGEDGDFGDMPDVGGEDAFGAFPGPFGGAEDADAPFMPGLDFDLADRPKTVGSTDIGYSRNSKFVDVKLVKKHLWDLISENVVQPKAQSKVQKGSGSFQGLVDRTVQRMPKGEMENLSVQVCFICALHLCNEKGLELETDKSRPLGDFNVVGGPQ